MLLDPVAAERLHTYLEASGHYLDDNSPLFRPLRGPQTGRGISAEGIYALVGQYAKSAGIAVAGLGVHGLRASAATNALEHDADITKVQAWLGHANISTTKLYDQRDSRAEVRRPSRFITDTTSRRNNWVGPPQWKPKITAHHNSG